jgi:hypothetical protein
MNDLLTRARTQAERASTPVRIAAQLHIARVQSVTDRSAGRITMEMAVAEIGSLPFKDRDFFLELARRAAAAVAPELIPEFAPLNQFRSPHDRFSAGSLIQIMLSHGHTDEAASFFLNYENASSFPFVYIGNVLAQTSDPERRLQLVRAAVKAWRADPEREFLWVLRAHWTVLPEDEARSILHEFVQSALTNQDSPMSATYDEGKLTFTSFREYELFEVLHILRRLDPSLAEKLLSTHPQLAAGAARYPYGLETMQEEAEKERDRRIAAGETCSGGLIMAGNPADRNYMMALHRASQDGDFAAALDGALQKYADDVHPEHPNHAPKEFWPSTVRFRQILYAAGRRDGSAARAHLEAIPDPDLRLLATIELCAALAGLPQLPSIQREHHPGWHRNRTPDGTSSEWKPRWPPERYSTSGAALFGARVRCPQCNWLPTENDRWACNCHHQWNTFATRGRCPSCDFQWGVTLCFSCGRPSPHRDWYIPEPHGGEPD